MTFGSLEPILGRSAERMARLTQEKLTQAASHAADFPPPACPRCGNEKLYRLKNLERRVTTVSGPIAFDRPNRPRARRVCGGMRRSETAFIGDGARCL